MYLMLQFISNVIIISVSKEGFLTVRIRRQDSSSYIILLRSRTVSCISLKSTSTHLAVGLVSRPSPVGQLDCLVLMFVLGGSDRGWSGNMLLEQEVSLEEPRGSH